MSEPIYDGFTWPVRKCKICGKVEEMPGRLCFMCREKRRMEEYLAERTKYPVISERGRIT